jgi:hypothetical protein
MVHPEAPPVTYQQFYDPEGVFRGGQLESYLDAKLAENTYVPGLGNLATRSLLLAEVLHANLTSADKLNDLPFAISANEAGEVASLVTQDAANVVGALHATIDEVRERQQRHSFYRPEYQESTILLGGKILAAAASDGIRRTSGRDYYSHPLEVAKIISLADQRSQGLEPEQLDRLLFLAYCHDAFEVTFPNGQGTFLRSPIVVSPLVVSEFLKSTGDAEHEDMANSLMLLSKPIGPGGKMPYLKYIKRGIPDPRYVIDKLADRQHNAVIEPKIARTIGPESDRIRLKGEEYAAARVMLLDAVNDLTDINLQFMAHTIASMTRRDLTNSRIPSNAVLHHSAMAALFNKNVAIARNYGHMADAQ